MYRFMPADALWAFAMACNVYLTFFHKYDSERLRRLEWKYVLCCYGLPFIPALSYFFIETQARGKVYGSAVVSGYTRNECALFLIFCIALVLDFALLGLSAHCIVLRSGLAHYLSDRWDLHTRRKSNLPEATTTARG